MHFTTLSALALLALPAFSNDIQGELVQYDWVNPDGSVEQNSRVGSIRLKLGDDALQLLASEGGGFINATVNNSATGGQDEWIVRNIYVAFEDFDSMQALPVVFDIGLGDAGGSPWLSSFLDVEVTEFATAGTSGALRPVWVSHEAFNRSATGWITNDGSLSDSSACDSSVTGSFGGHAGSSAPGTAPQDPKVTTHPVPAEEIAGGGITGFEPNDCGPASVAISLARMAQAQGAGSASTQSIFKALKEKMGTTETGTSTGGIVNGKNDYACSAEMPVCTEPVWGWEEWLWIVEYLIAGGHDVEVFLKRGECDDPCAPGHVAAVEGIVRGEGGEILLITIEPTADGGFERVFHGVDPDGKARDGDGKVVACMEGFLLEFWSNDPFACLCTGTAMPDQTRD